MKKPQQKITKKKIKEELEHYQNLYTKAIYSIMEIRYAMGDTEAKWSHPELMDNIKKLKEKDM
jgi:hypothetical protein